MSEEQGEIRKTTMTFIDFFDEVWDEDYVALERFFKRVCKAHGLDYDKMEGWAIGLVMEDE